MTKFKVISIVVVLMFHNFAESQMSSPEVIYSSILRKKELSLSDRKKLRISLGAQMSTASASGNLNKETLEILVYASLYSLYDPNFKKSADLNKFWKQQAVMDKAPEAELSELRIFEKLRSVVPKSEFLNTLNDYYSFIKAFDLKLHFPFLMFRCNSLIDVGQDLETKQCLEDVQKNISKEGTEYQDFALAKFFYYLTINDFKGAIEFAKSMVKISKSAREQNEWQLLLARAEFNSEQYDQVKQTILKIKEDSLGANWRVGYDLLNAELLSATGQTQEAVKVLLRHQDLPGDKKNLTRYFTIATTVYYNAGNLKSAQESTEKALAEVDGSFRQVSIARLSLVAFKLLNNVSISEEDRKYFEKATLDFKLFKADNDFLKDVIRAGYLLTQGGKPDKKNLEPILARILKVVSKNYSLAVLSKLKLT